MEENKFFLDKLFQLILERDRTIIFLVQLIIALLVIASFSEKIISNIDLIKNLITILLFLTTIMLTDYLFKVSDGLNFNTKVLSGKNNDSKKWFKKIIDGSVYLYALIIIIIIDIIIWSIILNIEILLYLLLVQTMIIAAYIFKKDK